MERIDEIMAKDRADLTDEDLEYLVEWRVRKRMREEEFKAQQQALHDHYEAVLEIERQKADDAARMLEEAHELALSQYRSTLDEQA